MTDTPKHTSQDALRSVALVPAQIEVGERLRKAKPHRVETLAADMQVQGQLQPILVCEAETTGKYMLVDGSHRLAALVSIKAAFVEAVVLPASSTPAMIQYAQIMANVNREELTKLERAEYLAELRDVWQQMNPLAQHGGDRRSTRVRAVKEQQAEEKNQSPILGLWSEVADKVNLGRSSFYSAIEIATKLGPALRNRIRETWIADQQAALMSLTKVSDDVQARACDLLLADPPEAGSMADALLLAEGRALPKNDDKHYHRVTATWSRLSIKSRRAFIDEHKREIIEHARKQGWTI
ncbi:ParB N-terminal domain-containing protein [Sulfitobacter sp. KE29]|uniref:ParB/RepB/Spo0J family partition protein n=1 Tax=unclassified Sulfitobacter TaxID=196795 RepID=UPI0023E0B19A|nr:MULTISPECIES: ParB N-terminal domain-containing protein [unclassified Sulfitobacter]MDF3420182.1 ParB N-terminal domain-containing protein [Sulfitobacter sp. Ks38]MDF3427667.1 ParB N-terminal domain-containing protein [Sulfitobacter sp. KE29]MDF3431246.1 ParB N-terminal domain-containing protein [Sulfitobacter sp. S46]MDF3446019.1 ParB N-terminal domain-containing protein [Sulfitobacter sp. KE31]MDF3550028.1 ParB N-terminal domain-containing protein [Sulfitobacter sp. KE28]